MERAADGLDTVTLAMVRRVFEDSAAALPRDPRTQEYKAILAARLLALAADGVRDPRRLRIAAQGITAGLKQRHDAARRSHVA